jgi:hypothetical protein
MDRATLAKRRPTTVSSREGYLVALFPQLVMFDKAPVGERLHHLSQFFSVVSGLSCGMDQMYGHSFAIHLCKKSIFRISISLI